MIDYLCLKLGWDTGKVLDNAHFDNRRKVEFYQALDDVERNRFIHAIPIGLDKKTSQKAAGRIKKAVARLNKFVGKEKDPAGDELLNMFGGKSGFEKFMKDMKNGKVEMKQLPISKFGSGNNG